MSETISYILKMSGGNLRRVTVPAEWNITYGQITPGLSAQERNRYGNNGPAGYAIRFYEGAKTTGKTKMVISGVLEFWPADIDMSEQHVETKRRQYGENAPEGFKNSVVEARVVSWRSVDGRDQDENSNKMLQQLEEVQS